jgi:hypothetical protein
VAVVLFLFVLVFVPGRWGGFEGTAPPPEEEEEALERSVEEETIEEEEGNTKGTDRGGGRGRRGGGGGGEAARSAHDRFPIKKGVAKGLGQSSAIRTKRKNGGSPIFMSSE